MFSLIPHRRAERKLAREFARPFGLMRPELPELFEHFFGRWPMMEWPWEEEIDRGLEVVEKEKEILVRVAMPGFEPAELVVEIVGNVLTLRAEHREKEVPEKKEEKMPEEPPLTRMLRSIMLPEGIDPEKVTALCKNGVLEVVIPRNPEVVPRRIEVKT
jgi:HSP20 family protein